jgi:hypothetical protein
MDPRAQRAFEALAHGFHRNKSYDGLAPKQKLASAYSLADAAASLGLTHGETLFLTNAFVEGVQTNTHTQTDEDEMDLEDFRRMVFCTRDDEGRDDEGLTQAMLGLFDRGRCASLSLCCVCVCEGGCELIHCNLVLIHSFMRCFTCLHPPLLHPS